MSRSPKLIHKMWRSRQRAINYIMKCLQIGKSRKAAWLHHRADGKAIDSDLYNLNYLQ